MGNERLLEYYRLFEELLRSMTEIDGFDLEQIKKALAELCKLFRISKGTTEFYKSINHEKTGKGDIFVGYDNGEDSIEIISRRIVTKTMAVVKCSAYMSKNDEPLSDVEYEKVDLIMKTLLSFISRNRLQSVVEKFAFYDNNGYRNVRSFIRYLEQLNEHNQLYGKAAVYFNLRHFTLINREIGRSAGDIAIRNYFTMIEEIVGEKGIVCRVGGDNFVAVFDDELLEDVLNILKGVPVVYDNNSNKRIMVSASTGVLRMTKNFVFEEAGDIMDRLVTSSQTAKMGGKDSIVFFDDKMEVGKEKRMKIQQLFPIALKNEEFKVFYQPKIDIETGELIGAEALCRWFRDGKIVPPMEFIPILEQNTDICQLDFYMLDHTCKDIRRWLDEGRKVVRVSVNLSRKHMMDVDLLEHIMEIVDRNNVPHEYIEIELTETTTDVEFRDLKRVVSGLQQAGICTSVDDFGMGYSSLNLIREIPWNVLKVDRSFLPLDDDNSQSTRSVMFKYVVGMAKELGLECIAEGVETEKQVKILRDNQCIFAQGYFFDKPLPLSEFEERLSSHRYKIDASENE
ncbi:putative bifunctional diguanylate cyclase/phosphodiesterase [Ruminococcus flavefaciens]|uniref:putative bifunctional diguanylate cyclase/phosphodiesterase n=1 Tax=Ruminococcus flavefaciens TaxID=1265 RepID=UPI0026ECCBBF|nr:bifunctional diguanylate cyclase/phosphodiesterase [Ruminococcus flavefaciens]MDD7516621.1 bifunctional diguanylate cyclase/phosphodiesterase [Ruminococcus flavefaciens]MDY5691104.1 bifunctional diguanylate cyclase/phosphodiesterase [Ruminococcus flavefaciens]